MEVAENDMGIGLMAVDRLMPIEIYRGIRNLIEGELGTLLLLLDSELTDEILVRREESTIFCVNLVKSRGFFAPAKHIRLFIHRWKLQKVDAFSITFRDRFYGNIPRKKSSCVTPSRRAILRSTFWMPVPYCAAFFGACASSAGRYSSDAFRRMYFRT